MDQSFDHLMAGLGVSWVYEATELPARYPLFQRCLRTRLNCSGQARPG